jgi:3-oxoacid CoA-transferase subunit A
VVGNLVYVTGDTHRDFDRIEDICITEHTTTDDVIVILGDVGINFLGEPHDLGIKIELSQYEVTLLCIYGNHEMRPENISSYEDIEWRGGIVYQEPDFPNLLFAKDGEIYDLEGYRCIAIGGANSIDKHRRVRGVSWWPDEQPSDKIKDRVEDRLAKENWKIDVVFSHTCPYKYMPEHALNPDVPECSVDNSTEEWLDTIEQHLDYYRWYCGHFHTDFSDGDIKFMWHDYTDLG